MIFRLLNALAAGVAGGLAVAWTDTRPVYIGLAIFNGLLCLAP